jgi:hypothetical protein
MIPYFRQVFGLYLLVHFVHLFFYADELFGTSMPYDKKLNPAYHIFPNAIDIVGAEWFVMILIVFTLMFTTNTFPAFSSIILCYGWSTLLNTNVLIYNPGIPYNGWLLLIMSIDPECKNKYLYWFSWFLTNIGYTISGIHKLQCYSWIDGSALWYILNSPLARNNCWRNILLQLPQSVLKTLTWGSLCLEIFTLPLGTFKYTRLVFWLLYMVFHVGILLVINFADLTIGMLMIHLYLFDMRWCIYMGTKTKNEIFY